VFSYFRVFVININSLCVLRGENIKKHRLLHGRFYYNCQLEY
jgi:hypothetical protein